ncbi:MAG: lysophospholipid acyltransferase family protein [Mycobacteriales bacterium]
MRRGKVGFWMRVAVCVLKPLLFVFTKHEWRGRDNIPKSGGVIIAVNHISYADPPITAHFVYDLPRLPRFLAKESLFRMPVVGWVVGGAGQIPVYRGTVSASTSLRGAVAAINRGEAVVIYPEGTVTKDPDLWPMVGKTGAARLALETGAPVVPVAQWGAQRLYDRRTRKLRLRPRTPVQLEAGPPVDLSRWIGRPLSAPVLREATDEIMGRLRDLVAGLRGETPPETFFVQPPRRPDRRERKKRLRTKSAPEEAAS